MIVVNHFWLQNIPNGLSEYIDVSNIKSCIYDTINTPVCNYAVRLNTYVTTIFRTPILICGSYTFSYLLQNNTSIKIF